MSQARSHFVRVDFGRGDAQNVATRLSSTVDPGEPAYVVVMMSAAIVALVAATDGHCACPSCLRRKNAARDALALFEPLAVPSKATQP